MNGVGANSSLRSVAINGEIIAICAIRGAVMRQESARHWLATGPSSRGWARKRDIDFDARCLRYSKRVVAATISSGPTLPMFVPDSAAR